MNNMGGMNMGGMNMSGMNSMGSTSSFGMTASGSSSAMGCQYGFGNNMVSNYLNENKLMFIIH